MWALWLFVSIAGYLGGGRATFWWLTRVDWPKSMSRENCTGHSYYFHQHNPNYCTEQRDLTKSRDRRVTTSYFWPLFFPFVLVILTVAGICKGSYKAITHPILSPAERTARRLALEQDVARAEAALQAEKNPGKHNGQPSDEAYRAELHKLLQRHQDRVTRPQTVYEDDDYETAPEVRLWGASPGRDDGRRTGCCASGRICARSAPGGWSGSAPASQTASSPAGRTCT